jgi:NhaA family Na+:H+ antiporter
VYKYLRKFIALETLGGTLLFCGAILGIIVSNTGLYEDYQNLVNLIIELRIGEYSLSKPLIKWVNDGFMSLFFLMLGLEMKYHVTEGEFQTFDKIFLSLFAAVGGVIVPAGLFIILNYNNPETLKGWAIPVAFDSAFTLAILSFFHDKISIQAKIFVIGLALVDDVFAISILALFYTGTLQMVPFLFATICALLLFIMNRLKVKYMALYLGVGLLLWLATVESGIHGTIAGILLALTIPTRIGNATLVKDLENSVHNLVTYIILPLFAFLNSEVPFTAITGEVLTSTLTLGIMLGLVVGKPLGILLFSVPLIKLKLTTLPNNTSWRTFIAISILNGIGFTLSLFISSLSFDTIELINEARIGIILSSCTAAILGILTLIDYKKSRKVLL